MMKILNNVISNSEYKHIGKKSRVSLILSKLKDVAPRKCRAQSKNVSIDGFEIIR